MTSKRTLERRLGEVADTADAAGSDTDREPWGLYPKGPERREAINATREVIRVASHVSDADLPDGRRENEHARLALLHDRFPGVVDTNRDSEVVETALPLLAGSDLYLDVPDLFIPFVAHVPERWSDATARAYSDAVASGDTETAHKLLVGLAYNVLADYDAVESGLEVPA